MCRTIALLRVRPLPTHNHCLRSCCSLVTNVATRAEIAISALFAMDILRWPVRSVSTNLQGYGRWMAQGSRPGWTVGITMVVVLALGAGMVIPITEPENDTEFLFTPREGEAKDDRTEFRALFPGNISRFHEILFSRQDGASIWNTADLTQVQAVNAFVLNASVSATIPQLDLQASGFLDCIASLPTTGAPVLTAPLCFTPDFETRFVGSTVAVSGTGANPAGLPGQTDSFVTAAEAVKLSFVTLGNTDQDIEDSTTWEADIEEALKSEVDRVNALGLNMWVRTETSLDRDLEASQGDDIILVVITFILLTNFAIFMNFSRDGVISRNHLAFAGVAAAGLSIPPTFGLMNFVGVPNTSLVGFAPFLVLAIGVDDVFVLISAYNKTDPRTSVADRMAATLAEAGVGITITSVTDALAFGIGATSLFPSVQIFCAYSGVALLLVYFLILLLFVPCMVWDARREAAGISNHSCKKAVEDKPAGEEAPAPPATATAPSVGDAKAAPPSEDFVGSNPMKESTPAPDTAPAAAPKDAAPPTSEAGQWEAVADLLVPQHTYVGKWMDRAFAVQLGPTLTTPWVVVVVMLLYAGLIALGAVGVANLPQGLKLQQLSPDTSQLVQFWEENSAFFNTRNGLPISVVVTGGLDFGLPANRALLPQMGEDLATLELIDSRDTTWVEAYNGFLGAAAGAVQTPAEFSGNISAFVTSGSGSRFRSDLTLVDASTGSVFEAEDVAGPAALVASGGRIAMTACRIVVRSVPFGDDTVKQANILITVRRRVSELRVSLGLGSAFAYSPAFIFFEQYENIESSTVNTLATAVAAMLGVAILLLPDFISVGLVTLNVITIDLGLFAGMWLFDIPLSTISMINLVLAIGLAVDASAHVAHAQLHSKGYARAAAAGKPVPAGVNVGTGVEGYFCGPSRRFRSVEAITEMGRPVFYGVGSTLVALLPVAFSSSYIFRTFGAMNAITLILSLLHAEVFLPVLLFLVGAPRIAHDTSVADSSCFDADATEPTGGDGSKKVAATTTEEV